MQGEEPGLEVQLPDGSMVGVPPVDGAFVVNLGDVMTLLTGNYFVATPHRVQARNDRFAVGFFYGPTLDTELAPLPLAPKFAAAVEASERHRTVGVMPRKDELVSHLCHHRPEPWQLWLPLPRTTAQDSPDSETQTSLRCQEDGIEDTLGGTSKYETYGDLLWQYFSRAYPDNVARWYANG